MVGVIDTYMSDFASMYGRGISVPVHRANVETYLDCNELFAAMKTGEWAQCCRSGPTVRQKSGLRIPIMIGKRKSSISNLSFDDRGFIDHAHYRHVADVKGMT